MPAEALAAAADCIWHSELCRDRSTWSMRPFITPANQVPALYWTSAKMRARPLYAH
jgi:hypothetical protein